MNTKSLFTRFKAVSLLTAALALGATENVNAQAPTSLSYPATNVFIANVSNVYLAPNLAGNAASYSISPALPAGLSFNTNTGVITGIPSAASASTAYTITATGNLPGQTSATTINIMVTNNFFDNNYATISFGGSGVTLLDGATGDTIDNSSTSSMGTAANDIVVYQNIATLSGQSIDCIVKTVSLTTGTTFSAYDQAAASGTNFNSNDPKFFSPQVNFPSGGSMQFNFQFILGGTYNTVTKKGTNVVLQNVKINTYDIDGNTQNNSNQINEFGGFTTSELGSGTSIEKPPVYNAATGLTTYRSSTTNNITTVTSDATRVRVTYNNISDFSIRMGGSGTAYFFVDFSAGPAFSTSDTTSAPSVDLNTSLLGVNNSASGCGTDLYFTKANQTNITSPANLTQLIVSVPVAEIANGANERLIVKGATAGSTIALNTDVTSTVTLGGNTYNVSSTVASNIRTLVFSKSSFTVANAEQLLDSLVYNNNASSPASGDRNFTVNVRNASFKSPNAVFTATLNCVSISGNVYHDVNGLVDATVNASGSAGQFAANAVYVVRVNPANNQVIDAKPIAAGGAYNFGTITPGAYHLFVSATNPSAGTTFTAATYPSGNYTASGENLGAVAGNDKQIDGKLTVTIGSENIANANFGLQIPPTTANKTISNIANPGGFNAYTILPNTFTVADADGTIDSIVINSFPTGANYIKVGSTVYTNGGQCPPQVSTCTPWPGTLVVPFSSGNPVPAILVDPATEGNTSVVINFTAWDNGRATSNTSDVTLGFIGSTSYNLNGNVWNDANSNGLQNGAEALTAPIDAGQTFYAVLIQQNHTYSGIGTILASTPVNTTTGYSFANVPSGNDYTIQIVSTATVPVAGAAASTISANLPQNWVAVSTNTDGSIVSNLNTNNPLINLINLSSSKNNLNFGLDRLPDATDMMTAVNTPQLGTLFTLNGVGLNPPVPPATDPEDGTLGSGNTIVITSLPLYTTLKYNSIAVTTGQNIPNFNPALLQIEITAATEHKSQTSFQFNYLDAAGKPDPVPATYTIIWGVNLAVTFGEFNATKEGSNTKLDWITYSEEHNKGFEVERSTDGRNWKQIGFVATTAQNGNSTAQLSYNFTDNTPSTGTNFYRLKQVDLNSGFAYSEIRKVTFEQADVVNIYPNPATNMVNVKITDASTVAAVNIIDLNGKVLIRTNNANQPIYIGTLVTGQYIIQVEQTNGTVSSFKLVKQ